MEPRPVHVLATTEEGTRSALETARRIADGRGARILVLVPQVVPYGQPLLRPSEDPTRIADRFRGVVAGSGIAAAVLVCVCREPSHVPGRMLIDRGEIVVGGRRRKWWPSGEERIARRLAGDGHDVVFAEVADSPMALKRSVSVTADSQGMRKC
jgi:hypothetical protein